MESEKYIVYFLFKGKEESQLAECIVNKVGNPLRYKLLIDAAIQEWGNSHKVSITANEITEIKVFNAERKLIVEQPIWTDTSTIKECNV